MRRFAFTPAVFGAKTGPNVWKIQVGALVLMAAFTACGRAAPEPARPAELAEARAAPAQAATPKAAATAAPAAVGGVSAAEWTVRWWQWSDRFPYGLKPYQDRDGGRCAMQQDEDGPVWFLAGTDGRFQAQRRCRVPLGKHLLVPVINMFYQGPREGADAPGCERLRASAARNNDALVSAVALLDGKPLPAPARLITRCFDPSADEAAGEAGDGDYQAVADGYWLLLPPLPAGLHRLSIGANYGASDEAYGRMVQNFEYELQIGDPAI